MHSQWSTFAGSRLDCPLRAIIEGPTVLPYLLLSRFHWKPREAAIRECLARYTDTITDATSLRIIDVGCGPGLLARTARQLNFGYIGIDPDQASIRYCQSCFRRWPNMDFVLGSLTDIAFTPGDSDVAVLNGVVHHLDDDELAHTLDRLSACRGIIIADHWHQPHSMRPLPRWMQTLDRGRYVRAFDYFQELSGWQLRDSVVFPIHILRIRFWTYFCNFYTRQAHRPRATGSSINHAQEVA